MLVQCPRCDCTYKVPDRLRGTVVPCPDCGAKNTAGAIEATDVEYEVRDGDTPEPAPVDAGPRGDEEARVFVTEEDTPWGTRRSYTVYMQRQVESKGLSCLSFGCLIFVLLAFLVVRGCMSLF